MQMQSVARISMQAAPGARPQVTPSHFAAGSRLRVTKSSSLSGHQRRQIIAMAENPISKAAKDVQQKAQDFGDEIKGNAEDTADKVEGAYKETNPEDNADKNPTEEYRSTELKNSNEKYTPKSDPKK